MRGLTDSLTVRILAGFFFLLLATAGLAWRVELPQAVGLLDGIVLTWAIVGVGLFGLSKLIHAARWQLLLKPFATPTYPEALRLFLVGNLINGLLPFRAGDVARVQIGARRLGVPRAQMVSSVFVVETLFDGLAFVGLLCWALALGDVPGLTRGIFLLLAAISVGACGAAALLSTRGPRIGQWLRRQPLPGAEHLGDAVSGLLDGLQPFAHPRDFARALVLACLGWILEAGAYASVGEAFNLRLDPVDYLAVMIAANLLTALPLTPLGFGIYELGLQELVRALGPEPELALAYVLGTHLVFSAWILVAGAAAAWMLSLQPADIFYLRRTGAGAGGAECLMEEVVKREADDGVPRQ